MTMCERASASADILAHSQLQKHLNKLLSRVTYVALINGQLDANFLDRDYESKRSLRRKYFLDLLSTLSKLIDQNLFIYDYYTTGHYTENRYSGVTLQFQNVKTRSPAYMIFRVKLSRQRTILNNKKGDNLSKKKFSPHPSGGFANFWLDSGLDAPRSWTSICDYMGKLKSIAFVGEYQKDEKLNKDSLNTLTLSYEQILKLESFNTDSANKNVSDKTRITFGQSSDNSRIKTSDKEIDVDQCLRAMEVNSSAGVCRRSSELTRSRVTNPPSFKEDNANHIKDTSSFKKNSNNKRESLREKSSDPRTQSNEEWLADYYVKPFNKTDLNITEVNQKEELKDDSEWDWDNANLDIL